MTRTMALAAAALTLSGTVFGSAAVRRVRVHGGAAERGVVQPVSDGYTYRRTAEAVRVTVTPAAMGMAGH